MLDLSATFDTLIITSSLLVWMRSLGYADWPWNGSGRIWRKEVSESPLTDLFQSALVWSVVLLQRVQNATARLIMDIGKYSHITPALYELHWLPVPVRIHFKILLLAFKAIHGLAPAYISNLLVIKHKSSYNLRSNSGILLEPPKVKCWQPWVNVHFRRLHRIYGMNYHCNYAVLDLYKFLRIQFIFFFRQFSQ